MLFERNVMYSVCIYNLSVLAVSRMGFHKKNIWIGFELYPIFFWIFGIFLTLQSPLATLNNCHSGHYLIFHIVVGLSHGAARRLFVHCRDEQFNCSRLPEKHLRSGRPAAGGPALCDTCLFCTVCDLFWSMVWVYTVWAFFQVTSTTATRCRHSRGYMGLK